MYFGSKQSNSVYFGSKQLRSTGLIFWVYLG